MSFVILNPRRPLIAALFVCTGVVAPLWSHAAGGHHAVDDATVLDPGSCQMEVWGEQASGRHLQHIGPACRWAGVELGIDGERSDSVPGSALLNGGVQAKWVTALRPGLAVGVEWSAQWQGAAARGDADPGKVQSDGPRGSASHFAGQTLLLPLTWSATEGLDVHLNLGWDFHPHAADAERYGAAVEWTPTQDWQLLTEAWRDDGGPQARLGLRRLVTDHLSLDLSRAEALRGLHRPWWTVGVNWVFGG
ncbi:hypothetical protein [Roseateles terrae]|uniref:Transporter n=1 Tax=Roseateles terrae TaxID=431060 RepID=A0ABR6GNH0_9BURK|nr:hypothetical protein [Roseateles terrae]MBB3193614.1 hypothetical protein [Roseateles terrae]OWQ89222.1 hypothetical protein CDN98_01315 [Roseateles terrae]